jgi:4-amino-4-deoxy-L-arabinose transferase-like glycosyltransferase
VITYLPVRKLALPICLLALLSFLGLFFRLGGLPLSGSDEPRYARIAQEMEQQGRWVTPILEGKPWLEKPPLYYWLTIPVYALLGTSETATRLAPACLAMFTALVVLWLGTLFWSRTAGFLGATILITSLGFIAFGRSGTTDMPLTAFLTAGLAAFAGAIAHKSFSRWKLWLGYGCVGLAILAKGPVALILAGGIVFLFWCLDERGGSIRAIHPAAGMAIAAAVSLPWYWLAFRQNGYSFIAVFFINHNFARYVSDVHHHAQPFYYYIPVLAGLVFPWSGWLPLLWPDSLRSTLRAWRQWDRRTMLLVCWIAFPLAFFSFSGSKLAGYVLPLLPPLALLLGVRVAALTERPGDSPGTRAATWAHLAVSAGIAIACPLAFHRMVDGAWATGICFSAAVLLPASFMFWSAGRGDWKRAFAATATQGVVLMLLLAVLAFPLLAGVYSTKGIAQSALRLRKPGESIVTFLFFHHTLFYYTNYEVTEEMMDGAALHHFLAARGSALVVTEAQRLSDLQSWPWLSITVLDAQNRLRLLRVAYVQPPG